MLRMSTGLRSRSLILILLIATVLPVGTASATERRSAATPWGSIARYTVHVGAGHWTSAWVECPVIGHTKATGGGQYNTATSGIILHESQPMDLSGRGWRVTVSNRGTTAATMTVYTICYDNLTNYHIAEAKDSAEPGQHGQAFAWCAGGTRVLGGGGSADTLNTRIDLNVGGEVDWVYSAQNLDSVPRTVTSRAICATVDVPPARYLQETYGIPPGGYTTVATPCRSAEGRPTLYSGGFQNPGYGFEVTDAYPENPALFRAYGRNNTPNRSSLGAYAYCGNGNLTVYNGEARGWYNTGLL